MAPPAARYRYNINKSSNNAPFSKKDLRRIIKEPNELMKIYKTRTPVSSTKVNTLNPSVNTAFKTFVSARLCSAIWSYVSDCDETFNYWEPLHYIINGHGLQTWEYSPQFALRSYTYLLLQGLPGWIYQKLVQPPPVLIFYMIRCILGFGCAVMERYMYKAICREFGIHIGRLWLIFQIFSVGMFVSSTALLPSSFSMYFGCAALSAWWQQSYNLAVFLTAISSFLGWPFAGLLGVPIAFDMLFRQRMFKSFIVWMLISAATIGIPMIVIDSAYFGRLVFAPLNIVIYNVLSSHGPNLYGTEPFSYYLINGFLNFNLIWIAAILTPIMLVADYFFIPARSKNTLYLPHYLSLSPLFLWLMVFFFQPHKEERFLFPIYPMINLCGAITVDIFQRIFFRLKTIFTKLTSGAHYLDHTTFIPLLFMLVSILLSFSRIFALYRNYHAPMDILIELNQFKNTPDFNADKIYNVCVGKDWYRFPGSFFFPSKNFRIRFLQSEFKGILPAYYEGLENATTIPHSYFNDMNQESLHMYFDYNKCHFLIDLDDGKYSELQPNYSAKLKEWSIFKSLPFLIQEKSHRLLRAFYIPFLSDSHITYGNFNLLRRKKWKQG